MKKTALFIAAAAGLTLATTASAGIVEVDLGGGWEATIFDPMYLDLVTDYVSVEDNILVIEKFAEFTRIDPFTGQPEPLLVTFRQNADDANTVSRIVITDEVVINSTGVDWNAFRMILAPGVATFNQALSADFSIDPFQNRSYSDDSTEVEFSGGVVGNGDIWTPGYDRGGLVIDIDLDRDEPVNFTLKELPVPTPGALALATLGGIGIAVRRRRA